MTRLLVNVRDALFDAANCLNGGCDVEADTLFVLTDGWATDAFFVTVAWFTSVDVV